MVIVLLILGVGLVALLAVAPFVLPWPRRVRWLVLTATTPMDPLAIGPGVSPTTRWDAVTLRHVKCGPDPSVEVLSLISAGTAQLCRPGASATDLARLEGWAANATPLLLVEGFDGGASLHDAELAVRGLRREHSTSSFGTAPEPWLGELTPADLELLGVTPGAPAERRGV
jgi:hypothetical protein